MRGRQQTFKPLSVSPARSGLSVKYLESRSFFALGTTLCRSGAPSMAGICRVEKSHIGQPEIACSNEIYKKVAI